MSKVVYSVLFIVACTSAPLETSEVTNALNPTSLCPASVPSKLTAALPAGQELKAAYSARGYQIYKCSPTTTGGYAWVFQYPSADLLDQNGNVVGTHFIGPTWQFHDGSSVKGAKIAAAQPDLTAIPWLVLKAIANTDSPDGDGRFADITYVQRLSTVGGNAPADGCDATHAGDMANVDYTANYFFYHLGDNDSRRCQ